MSASRFAVAMPGRGKCLTLMVLMLMLVFSFGPRLYAEDPKASIAAQIKSLNLNQDELRALEDIVLDENRTIQTNRAEVNADRAELTRALLVANVTTKDLEPIVRRSIEAEMNLRMADLDRQLKIRKLLGNARWASLSALVTDFRTSASQNSAGSPDDLTFNRVINLLRLM